MKKLVIIPAYNESESIKKTVEDIKSNAPDFDYVVINDCSTDNTRTICEENGFNVLNLPVNLGIGGAVQSGYLYAYQNGYDIAVQFDGDGQHDAAFLNLLFETMMEYDLDMIIGSRFITNEGFTSSGMRRVGIRFLSFLIKLLTGTKITDPTSGMRMINREVITLFQKEYPKDYPEPESVTDVLARKLKVKEIPVVMKAREAGVSSISPRKSIYFMVKVSLAIIVASTRRK